MTLQPPLEGLADYRLPDRTRIVQSLSDIADRLELSSQERHAMLGGRLINEMNAFMEQRFSLKLPS